MGDEYECGLAVNLETHYTAPARIGEPLEVAAIVARRGGRLATVSVEARTRKNKLVFAGTVTKSLRGLRKAAARKRG